MIFVLFIEKLGQMIDVNKKIEETFVTLWTIVINFFLALFFRLFFFALPPDVKRNQMKQAKEKHEQMNLQ